MVKENMQSRTTTTQEEGEGEEERGGADLRGESRLRTGMHRREREEGRQRGAGLARLPSSQSLRGGTLASSSLSQPGRRESSSAPTDIGRRKVERESAASATVQRLVDGSIGVVPARSACNNARPAPRPAHGGRGSREMSARPLSPTAARRESRRASRAKSPARGAHRMAARARGPRHVGLEPTRDGEGVHLLATVGGGGCNRCNGGCAKHLRPPRGGC